MILKSPGKCLNFRKFCLTANGRGLLWSQTLTAITFLIDNFEFFSMTAHPPSPSCSGDWGKELCTSLGIAAKAYLSKKNHLLFWITIKSKLIFNLHTVLSFLIDFTMSSVITQCYFRKWTLHLLTEKLPLVKKINLWGFDSFYYKPLKPEP